MILWKKIGNYCEILILEWLDKAQRSNLHNVKYFGSMWSSYSAHSDQASWDLRTIWKK